MKLFSFISTSRTLKRAALVAVAAASAIGGIVTMAAPAANASSFSCGPQTLTYSVSSLGGAVGTGVRCVKPFDEFGMGFAWYGEGNWYGYTYRNVGKAVYLPGGSVLQSTGYAADIVGNGENINGGVQNGTLLITAVAMSGSTVTAFDVTGAWNERWTLVSSMAYAPLPKPTTCGPNFTQFSVYAYGPVGAPMGIRCLLPIFSGGESVWYGNGHWGATTYSHIGIINGGGYAGEASDLCGPNFGIFCNQTPIGGIHFNSVMGSTGFDLTGSWYESWR